MAVEAEGADETINRLLRICGERHGLVYLYLIVISTRFESRLTRLSDPNVHLLSDCGVHHSGWGAQMFLLISRPSNQI
jgi:hypothetical protein